MQGRGNVSSDSQNEWDGAEVRKGLGSTGHKNEKKGKVQCHREREDVEVGVKARDRPPLCYLAPPAVC